MVGHCCQIILKIKGRMRKILTIQHLPYKSIMRKAYIAELTSSEDKCDLDLGGKNHRFCVPEPEAHLMIFLNSFNIFKPTRVGSYISKCGLLYHVLTQPPYF
jgi:hypothetical protein